MKGGATPAPKSVRPGGNTGVKPLKSAMRKTQKGFAPPPTTSYKNHPSEVITRERQVRHAENTNNFEYKNLNTQEGRIRTTVENNRLVQRMYPREYEAFVKPTYATFIDYKGERVTQVVNNTFKNAPPSRNLIRTVKPQNTAKPQSNLAKTLQQALQAQSPPSVLTPKPNMTRNQIRTHPNTIITQIGNTTQYNLTNKKGNKYIINENNL